MPKIHSWTKPAMASVDGYPAFITTMPEDVSDTTTLEYAAEQARVNAQKTVDYLLPVIRQCGAEKVLDVGCGVGQMVRTLVENGYDAYGVDLPGLARFWRTSGHPTDRFFIVDPMAFELPFYDSTLDFAFSFGVIEHVGTSDGHTDRMENYHAIRKQWLREVFRAIRPGGRLLIGGPNRNFPIDVAHGLDSRATACERMLSRWAGISIHKTWGEYFLWSYSDFPSYLDGLDYSLSALSIDRFLNHSRVVRLARPLSQFYTRYLPPPLYGTGFNPWVMALITKVR